MCCAEGSGAGRAHQGLQLQEFALPEEVLRVLPGQGALLQHVPVSAPVASTWLSSAAVGEDRNVIAAMSIKCHVTEGNGCFHKMSWQSVSQIGPATLMGPNSSC